MTAEIAVMNQEAVALAADSAVTVEGSSGGSKIFTSANKIFALSKYHPVAVMVNDSAEFLSVPWETIVKTYRAKLGKVGFSTLKEYADDFLRSFDQSEPLFPRERQELSNEAIISDAFFRILEQIDDELEERTEAGEEPTDKDIRSVVTGAIQAAADEWKSVSPLASLPKKHSEAVAQEYKGVINEVVKGIFQNLPVSTAAHKRLHELAVGLLTKGKSNQNAPYHTGLVIAGFGKDEYFPQLFEFELETIALDHLKYHMEVSTGVDPTASRAVIRAFAQKEQVATFMEGIDNAVANAILHYWRDGLPALVAKVADHLKFDDTAKQQLLSDLGPACHDDLTSFRDGLQEMVNDYYVQPVIRMVGMMPKDELAAMAESLVNLTSFKRKVTEEAETVGGPIDVAVISKGDGLVWVKRKHYFRPELNPQFFANYYADEED